MTATPSQGMMTIPNTSTPQLMPMVPMPAHHRAPPLLPANMGEAMRLAEIMAQGKLVPAHLQKSPADCLAVILQSVRWQTDPFSTAQATSVISGKLMFEGKLVAAVVNTSGRLRGRLDYAFDGQGDDRSVTCSGWIIGEPAPVSVTVRLRDAKTGNKIWLSQPDQQLSYHSARVWARRYLPELMLGIYSAEEMPTDSAPAVEQRQEQQQQLTPPAEQQRATPTIELRNPSSGGSVAFAKTRHGIGELIKFAALADAGVVLANLEVFDTIADKMPEHADAIAEIRARAAKALTPAESWPGEAAGAEMPESAPESAESARRAAIKDGAPPAEDDDAI